LLGITTMLSGGITYKKSHIITGVQYQH